MSLEPQKRAHFRLIESGLITLEPASIFSFDPPEETASVSEHTEENFKVETISRITTGDATLVLMNDQGNGAAHQWVIDHNAWDPETGEILSGARFDMICQSLAWDQLTVVDEWRLVGCLQKNKNVEAFEQNSNDNQQFTVTLHVKKSIPRVL